MTDWLARRSLARRMALAFLLSHAAVLFAALFLLRPVLLAVDEDVHYGPDVAAYLALPGLKRGLDGAPAFDPTPELRRLAARSPELWMLVEAGGHRFAFGRPPPPAAAALARFPAELREADLLLPGPRPLADAKVTTVPSPAGPARFAVGGVRPEAIDLRAWLQYLLRTEMLLVVPVLAALGIVAVAIVVPFVLRALRPLALAAERVGPGEPARRLPEAGTARELLPLVRGFNAALDRLGVAFDRQRRFVADVAHELRTPVAVLGMQVEALPDGGAKRDLQRGVFRLGQLVGQMLDAERLVLAERRREPVDLVALARAAAADVAPLAVDAGYELAVRAELPARWALIDGAAVGRALGNLLGNAVAHGGRRGAITLRVGADGALEVADQGPGVPASAQERIFEPFRRERWDLDGCGLGVHLAREIMRAHGGDAALARSDGEGAIFRLTLPRAALLDGAR